MIVTYDEGKGKFVSLGSLKKNDKANFANKIFDRVSDMLSEFEKLPLKKGSNMEGQELLMHMFKLSLPMMWHYKLNRLVISKFIDFVPEGVENCAELYLKEKTQISIWKYDETPEKSSRNRKGMFKLQWCPSFVFEAIASSKYTWMTKRNCASFWSDVCKKNKLGITPWDRTTTASIREYLEEVSKV